jgi:GNAT superfamily N-acetyltransferase
MIRRVLDFDRDYPCILEMYRLSWQINFPGTTFSETWFAAALRVGAGKGQAWVYLLREEIAGWLWLDFSDWGVGHIKHIQVHQPHWGRGLGRSIVEDAVRLCQQRGCAAMTLTVTKTNTHALTLYEHLGFALFEDQGERQRMRLELPAALLEEPARS